MTDPVLTKYGLNFERSAILDWLRRGNSVCPITRRELTLRMIIPNTELRMQIAQWSKVVRGEINPEVYDDDDRRVDFFIPSNTEPIIKNMIQNYEERKGSMKSKNVFQYLERMWARRTEL